MMTVLPTFIVVIMAITQPSLSLLSDLEMKDNVDRTARVKRQWGWNSYYKFKTPFYKVKISSPFSYGGNMYPFGGAYGAPGYYGYHPPLHMPYLFGGYHWI